MPHMMNKLAFEYYKVSRRSFQASYSVDVTALWGLGGTQMTMCLSALV